MLVGALVLCQSNLWAQGSVTVAKELAEQLIRRFSKEVADEGVEKLTTRVQAVLVQSGDDALRAIEKGGPRALRILEGSGADAAISARLLSKYGDEAIGALENPVRLGMVRQFGQEAGEVLIKHGVVAEKLGVVGRYGDRAMDFVWRNKLALTAGTALAVFVADPEPFLDGTRQLVENTVDTVATNIGKPIAEQLGNATDWTWRILALAAMLLGFWAWKTRGSRQAANK